ncbi:antitoxin family protein [Thiohalocapsa sp. ML1]|uniref:antitoxin family protein n=1 Tax=Thiohalocapsa sp. ML1 TaxID=1431688 RepID=UPI0007322D3B|nr:antitoxin family protein [Thiohalocapsa sp. ML1]
MPLHLKAVYEHGVLRPLAPLDLEEHQEVCLVLESTDEAGHPSGANREAKPIWEIAADLVRNIPEDALNDTPTDGAAEHDHYLYGTAKRD